MVAPRGNLNTSNNLSNSNQPRLYAAENSIIPVALGKPYQLTEMLHSGFGNTIPTYANYVKGVRELYAYKKVNEMLAATSNAVGRDIKYLDGVVSSLADGAGITVRHASRLGTNNAVIRDMFGAVSLYNPSTAQLEQIANKSTMVRGINNYNSIVNQYKATNPGVSWLESVAGNLTTNDPLRASTSGLLSKDIDGQTRFAPVEAKIYRATDLAVTPDKNLKQAMLAAKQNYMSTLFFHYSGDEKAIKTAMGLQYSTTTVRTMMQRWQMNPDQMMANLHQYQALRTHIEHGKTSPNTQINNPHQIDINFKQSKRQSVPISLSKTGINSESVSHKQNEPVSVRDADPMTKALLENAFHRMRSDNSGGSKNVDHTLTSKQPIIPKLRLDKRSNDKKLMSGKFSLN